VDRRQGSPGRVPRIVGGRRTGHRELRDTVRRWGAGYGSATSLSVVRGGGHDLQAPAGRVATIVGDKTAWGEDVTKAYRPSRGALAQERARLWPQRRANIANQVAGASR